MIYIDFFLALPLAMVVVTPGMPATARSSLPARILPIGLLAIVMALFGWFDPFHLTIAAILLVVFKFLGLLTPSPVGTTRVDGLKLEREAGLVVDLPVEEPSPVRVVAGQAVARDLLLVMIFIAASWLASLVPGLDTLAFDRDRPEIDLKLDTLEDAGDWSAASELILSRLERRTSRQWRALLTGRLYAELVAAGAASSGQHAEALFRQALALADENGLDRQLAATHLDRLQLRGAVDRQNRIAMELARSDQERQAMVQRRDSQIADAKRQRADLDSQLAASRRQADLLQQNLSQAQADRARTEKDNAEAMSQLLLGWGDSLEPGHPLRRTKYDEAEATAVRHGLPTNRVRERIAELNRLLALQQPADLPAGATAVVQRVDATTFPPLTVLDLAVQLPTGKPLTDLTTKDFVVRAGRAPPARPLVVETRTSAPQAMQVVVLLDCSDSTRGPAQAAAKTGVAGLLRQLRGVAAVKLVSFATTVAVVCDWTDDPTACIGPLEKITTAGNTALLQAIARAVGDLADRQGPKAIILFTDGGDNIGGPSLPDLTARCRKAGIVVHVVALETAELDREFLTQLTQANGGLLLSTSKVDELPLRFRQAAEALRVPYYRIVLVGLPANTWEIVVGRANAVRVKAPVTQANTHSVQENRR